MSVGITGYSAYLPKPRLRREEIARAWGHVAAPGLQEKAVPDCDEDVLTMAAAALLPGVNGLAPGVGRRLLSLASGTLPAGDKHSPASLAALVGWDGLLQTTQHGSSGRSGLEALRTAEAYLLAGLADEAAVVAADALTAAPGDPLDHSLGAGAAALTIGRDAPIALLEGSCSAVAEWLGDRHRPRGERHLQDLGVRDYTAVGLQRVLRTPVEGLLKELGAAPAEFAHVVLPSHEPGSVWGVARQLGFKDPQLTAGWLFPRTGDTGSAGPLLGLIAALELAEPGDRILVVAFGSGAACDAMALRATGELAPWRERRGPVLAPALAAGRPVDYLTYLKLRGDLR